MDASPLPLRGVVIACYKHDYWLARASIASIRFFYPELPIFLLKDLAAGRFSTRDAEKHWGVQVLDLGRHQWGNAGSRLSLLPTSLPGGAGRYLYIDADICFLGRVVDRLEQIPADFVVAASRIDDPMDAHVREFYYEIEKVREWDPAFQYPGFVFNAGQFVFTPGAIPAERLNAVFDLRAKPRLRVAGLRHLDQGGLNYLLPRLAEEGVLTLRRDVFYLFAHPSNPEFMALDFNEVTGEGVPKLAHWAGEKVWKMSRFPRGEILVFFSDHFYAKIPGGAFFKGWNDLKRCIRWERWAFVHGWKVRLLGWKKRLGLR